MSHINGHIIHPFSTFSFLFLIFFLINFQTYCYTFSNFSPPFYLFISLLLSTLISFFLYPFIFLYFLLFLFPTSYYKFTILFSILFIVFSHTKCYFSLFLSLILHTQKIIFLSFSFSFFFFIFGEFFNIFFLHLYFRLINFWYYLELYFGLM